eukprot:3255211-Prymnesium_polylepis.1
MLILADLPAATSPAFAVGPVLPLRSGCCGRLALATGPDRESSISSVECACVPTVALGDLSFGSP